MSPSEEFAILTESLLDSLYVLLSLSRVESFAPTVIKYRGQKLAVPSNVVVMLKVATQLSSFIAELRRVLLSPARMLQEEVVIGREVKGPLHLPLTVQLRGRGLQLVAYRQRRLTLSSPENILLKLFLRRLLTDTEHALRDLESIRIEGSEGRVLVLGGFLLKLERQLDSLRKKLESIDGLPFIREISTKDLKPDDQTLLKLSQVVLRRGMQGYRRLAALVQRYLKEKLDVRLVGDDVEQYRHLAVAIKPYKLYEVFTYYATAVALVEALRSPASIAMSGSIIEVRVPGRAEYTLLYDEPIPERSWLHLGKVRFDGVERRRVPPGRPDVTLLLEKNPLLVLDAKYTESYEYISQSRYKILGYLDEYSLNVGALVYDPNRLSKEPVDEEDVEFSSLLGEASRYGGAVLEDANKRVYLIPLKPANWSELSRTRAYALVVDMIKGMLD